MPICEANPAQDTDIPAVLLDHVQTLNLILSEKGYDPAREYLEAQGDEMWSYPYMVAAIVDEGDAVSRFGILKHVVPGRPPAR